MTAQHDVNLLDLYERGVLAGSMQSPKTFMEAKRVLSPKDFYSPEHEEIFRAITEIGQERLNGGDLVPDFRTVLSHLQKKGNIEKAGGYKKIVGLNDETITVANVAHHIREVKQDSMRRSVKAALQSTLLSVEHMMTDRPVESVLNQLQEVVEDLAQSARGNVSESNQIFSSFPEVKDHLDGNVPELISTGWPDLDDVIGGLMPGRMIVIGARPGVGKTVCLENLQEAVALQASPTLMFSYEMNEKEILARLLNSYCGIPNRNLNLQRPNMEERDWVRLQNSVEKIAALPFYVSSNTSMTVQDIDAAIGRFKAIHPDCKVIGIDYLGIVPDGPDSRHSNRQELVSANARALKMSAMRHQVCIVVLSQLNRESASRNGGVPQLTDLRESGAIEQDADQVILLHRPDTIDPETERAGEVDLIVAKNRHGEARSVTLAAQMHLYRFQQLQRDGF